MGGKKRAFAAKFLVFYQFNTLIFLFCLQR
jgi:hypothetical protein